jgi:predicted HicB family RNase H-like nuclease
MRLKEQGMIATEKHTEVKRTAENLIALGTDWVTFYREILGLRGVVRHVFPTREALATFEHSEAYQEILQLLTQLRQQTPILTDPEQAAPKEADEEPTRVITVRLPKSLHETLRVEAHEHHTSMNKLCISKLLQFIDGDKVPTER